VVRAMATPRWASAPVKKFMSPKPETLKLGDPVAYALNKMSVGRFRHVPIVDADGTLVGMISIRDIVDFIVELCPEEILNLPSQPELAIPRSTDGG
jgi:CBS domain-containing protein